MKPAIVKPVSYQETGNCVHNCGTGKCVADSGVFQPATVSAVSWSETGNFVSGKNRFEIHHKNCIDY